MKENVFDVLMYLFENYYMDDDSTPAPDREIVQQELSQAGFPTREIDRAFTWMDGLMDDQCRPSVQAEHSIRHYAGAELDRLDTECRGFLLFLEQMGVLSPESRELAIDRAMARDTEDFDLDQLKWVILMVLFNQPGKQEAYAWVEDLVFESAPHNLH
jgi:Smg protein